MRVVKFMLITTVFTYGVFAFLSLNLNPVDWNFDMRYGFISVIFTLTVTYAAVLPLWTKK